MKTCLAVMAMAMAVGLMAAEEAKAQANEAEFKVYVNLMTSSTAEPSSASMYYVEAEAHNQMEGGINGVPVDPFFDMELEYDGYVSTGMGYIHSYKASIMMPHKDAFDNDIQYFAKVYKWQAGSPGSFQVLRTNSLFDLPFSWSTSG
jgi:hypothetical protein